MKVVKRLTRDSTVSNHVFIALSIILLDNKKQIALNFKLFAFFVVARSVYEIAPKLLIKPHLNCIIIVNIAFRRLRSCK